MATNSEDLTMVNAVRGNAVRGNAAKKIIMRK